MNLSDPRAPFLFGIVMIGLMAAYLLVFHAMPGPLARPHAQVIVGSGLRTCDACHQSAGLTAGCLSCHREINEQLETERGYHASLAGEGHEDCSSCHPEHLGADFPLVSRLSWQGADPNQFRHDHVAFTLAGAHEGLACVACHGREDFALPGFASYRRRSTYLGLTQECVDCHENVHAAGVTADCLSCHNQTQWDPASGFRHDDYFVLEGAHASAECSGCHLISVSGDPNMPAAEGGDMVFGRVRGETCAECHESPHRVQLAEDCTHCHLAADSTWADGTRGVTTESHAAFGFALDAVHADVACELCHRPDQPYAQRYSDPDAPGHARSANRCESCHGDPHAGQFQGRYATCLDCHDAGHFTPARFDATEHAKTFPLVGAHTSLECTACHTADPNTGVRQFVSLPQDCEGCHGDPHAGQFQDRYATCLDCHDADHFTPARFDATEHAKTFPLVGAHASLECTACHTADPNTGVRQFVSLSQDCEDCHGDPHGGQFQGRYATCLDCHDAERFTPARFDATEHAKTFPLVGAHASVECTACHTTDPNTGVRQFVSLSQDCEDCHGDPHAGQFEGRYASCLDCHDENHFTPARYDVLRHAAVFPLTGAHATVPCTQCHAAKGQQDVRQFVSTPRQCKNCHTDPHGPQFQTDIHEADCTVCHAADAVTFEIRSFDHGQRTGYTLDGAHAQAQCVDCHRQRSAGDPDAPTFVYRIYRGTSTACASCHRDEHRGQFRQDGVTQCERCHGSSLQWSAERFDHNRDARFALEGAHADLACERCHPPVRQPDGAYVTQYRPLGTRCEDCHASVPQS